jgi:hypothetical protein
MSYHPSRENGCKAIQLDQNATAILSQDFTEKTTETLTSSGKYFIESRKYAVVNTSSSGLVLYRNWAGFDWAGATIRCNLVSTTSTITDECYIGANTPNAQLTTSSNEIGAANIVSQTHINAFWRLS